MMDGGNTVCFGIFADYVEPYLLINLPPTSPLRLPYRTTPMELTR